MWQQMSDVDSPWTHPASDWNLAACRGGSACPHVPCTGQIQGRGWSCADSPFGPQAGLALVCDWEYALLRWLQKISDSLFCTASPHDCVWQQFCLLCCLHDEGSQLSQVLEAPNPIPKHRLAYGHLWSSPQSKSHYFLPSSFQGKQDRKHQGSQAHPPSLESLQSSSSLLGAPSFYICPTHRL